MIIAEFFQDLIDISGIDAVILFDNQNSVIDMWNSPKYNPTIFPELGEAFLHVFGLIEHLDYDMEEIVVPFDKGLVLGRTGDRFYLVIIARPLVDVALIRLAVNVCLTEFEKDRKVKKILKKLSEKKFYQIKSADLDDVEKIMLENILEDKNEI